jgi:hypothetical protein
MRYDLVMFVGGNMKIRLELDSETSMALIAQARAERRTATLQAEVMLRRALGLPFPYPLLPCTSHSEEVPPQEPAASQGEPVSVATPHGGGLCQA